jgi:hypothetical protein
MSAFSLPGQCEIVITVKYRVDGYFQVLCNLSAPMGVLWLKHPIPPALSVFRRQQQSVTLKGGCLPQTRMIHKGGQQTWDFKHSFRRCR